MAPGDTSALYEQCSSRLAQGQPVDVDQVSQLLALPPRALLRVAEFAYPLSHPDVAIQIVIRDLLLVLQHRSGTSGLATALAQVADAAARPGPGLIALLAEANRVPGRD